MTHCPHSQDNTFMIPCSGKHFWLKVQNTPACQYPSLNSTSSTSWHSELSAWVIRSEWSLRAAGFLSLLFCLPYLFNICCSFQIFFCKQAWFKALLQMMVSSCGHCKTAPHGESLCNLSFVKLLLEETFVQRAQPLRSWLFFELCAGIWLPVACPRPQFQLLLLAQDSSISPPKLCCRNPGVADVFLVTVDHSTWHKQLHQGRIYLTQGFHRLWCFMVGRARGNGAAHFIPGRRQRKGDCGRLLALHFFPPFIPTRLSRPWGLGQPTFKENCNHPILSGKALNIDTSPTS